MKMKLKILAAVTGLLLITACFSPWNGDEGVFTISVGGGGNARAALPWNEEIEIDDLVHTITVSGGPGPKQELDVTGSKTIRFSVNPGIWEIFVHAYKYGANNGKTEIADAYVLVEIEPGPNDVVIIQMKQVYAIGEEGPAGGIIFYDKKNHSGGWRYLEAAPGDEEDEYPWANSLFSSAGTGEGMGFGKNNTKLLLTYLAKQDNPDNNFYAAQAAVKPKNDYEDWFLPSIGELMYMFRYSQQANDRLFSADGTYWSSSEANNGNAYSVEFTNGVSSRKTSAVEDQYFVRAIRQF